jgi:uncharacterized membrane protein YqjE
MAQDAVTGTGQEPRPPTEDASLADLTQQLTEQVTRLAHQEIELAKAEMAQKGRRAGIGAGMFGGAALLGALALALFTACVVAALDHALPLWLAILVVGVVVALAAGLLALAGRTEVRGATPLAPSQATESVKEDIEWVKAQAKAGRE